MRLFKLTDRNMRTYGKTQWTLGEWKETDGSGELCSAGWLHAYRDPYLALLMNPLHADFANPRLFEAEAEGEFKDDNGMKCGVTRLRLIKEIDGISISTEERVEFAIQLTLKVYQEKSFVEWATNWLDGSNRSFMAAEAAEAAGAARAGAARAEAEWAGAARAGAARAGAEWAGAGAAAAAAAKWAAGAGAARAEAEWAAGAGAARAEAEWAAARAAATRAAARAAAATAGAARAAARAAEAVARIAKAKTTENDIVLSLINEMWRTNE